MNQLLAPAEPVQSPSSAATLEDDGKLRALNTISALASIFGGITIDLINPPHNDDEQKQQPPEQMPQQRVESAAVLQQQQQVAKREETPAPSIPSIPKQASLKEEDRQLSVQPDSVAAWSREIKGRKTHRQLSDEVSFPDCSEVISTKTTKDPSSVFSVQILDQPLLLDDSNNDDSNNNSSNTLQDDSEGGDPLAAWIAANDTNTNNVDGGLLGEEKVASSSSSPPASPPPPRIHYDKNGNRVFFRSKVSMVEVPHFADVDPDIAEKIWTSPDEVHRNLERNAWEYNSVGRDWTKVLEEDQMIYDPRTGEYIHPATWEIMQIEQQQREELNRLAQAELERRQQYFQDQIAQAQALKEQQQQQQQQQAVNGSTTNLKKSKLKRRQTGAQPLLASSSGGGEGGGSHGQINNSPTTKSLSPKRNSPLSSAPSPNGRRRRTKSQPPQGRNNDNAGVGVGVGGRRQQQQRHQRQQRKSPTSSTYRRRAKSLSPAPPSNTNNRSGGRGVSNNTSKKSSASGNHYHNGGRRSSASSRALVVRQQQAVGGGPTSSCLFSFADT